MLIKLYMNSIDQEISNPPSIMNYTQQEYSPFCAWHDGYGGGGGNDPTPGRDSNSHDSGFSPKTKELNLRDCLKIKFERDGSAFIYICNNQKIFYADQEATKLISYCLELPLKHIERKFPWLIKNLMLE